MLISPSGPAMQLPCAFDPVAVGSTVSDLHQSAIGERCERCSGSWSIGAAYLMLCTPLRQARCSRAPAPSTPASATEAFGRCWNGLYGIWRQFAATVRRPHTGALLPGVTARTSPSYEASLLRRSPPPKTIIVAEIH